MWNLNPTPDHSIPLRCIASTNILLYADEVKLACESRLRGIETQIGKQVDKLARDYARGNPNDQVRLNAFLRSVGKSPDEYAAKRKKSYLRWVDGRIKGNDFPMWQPEGITDKDIEMLENELNPYGKMPSQLRELAKKCEKKIENNVDANVRPLVKVSARELLGFVDQLEPAPIHEENL